MSAPEKAPGTLPSDDPEAKARAFYERYHHLRLRLAIAVGIVALLGAAAYQLAIAMFSIQPGAGAPVGLGVRTDRHFAIWHQRLEAYVPSLHRDAGKDRYTLSVLLLPLDGGPERLVEVHRGLRPSEFQLARILGSDGSRLWVDAVGTSTIDLTTGAVQRADAAPPNLRGEPKGRLQPNPSANLAAGYLLDQQHWLGVLAAAEVERSYGPRQFVRRVVPTAPGKQPRRFHAADVEADSTERYYRVARIAELTNVDYQQAAFLRQDEQSEPFRLQDPPGAVLLFSASAALGSTLVVARSTDEGQLLWQQDTGLDHFALQQILPGATATVFVGTRPRQPDRVPEPLAVVVDHRTGELRSHSLWR
jgi:hypothetical protein